MTKPFAYNLTRKDLCYRHDAFSAGLQAAGFDVREQYAQAKPGDVLLIWNRYGTNHDIATRFEALGGTVLVAENGYLGPAGVSPHSMDPRSIYALARTAHNGAGEWNAGNAGRFDAIGGGVKPWRQDGEHVLVCPNRSFGTPGLIMPADWPQQVKRTLARATGREVRLRPHPGNSPHPKPLSADLLGAWAMVIWASSAGVHALLAGIPVLCDAPKWICKSATGSIDQVEQPPTPARAAAFERLAWAQWSIGEIESGEPFRRLLHNA